MGCRPGSLPRVAPRERLGLVSEGSQFAIICANGRTQRAEILNTVSVWFREWTSFFIFLLELFVLFGLV